MAQQKKQRRSRTITLSPTALKLDDTANRQCQSPQNKNCHACCDIGSEVEGSLDHRDLMAKLQWTIITIRQRHPRLYHKDLMKEAY